MLVAASVVFLYYSIWTLLMVCRIPSPVLLPETYAHCPALRRLGPSSPERLPSARLGYPYSRHPYPLGLSRCGIFLERCHDSKQQEESSKSEGGRKEEGLRPFYRGRQHSRSRTLVKRVTVRVREVQIGLKKLWPWKSRRHARGLWM